MPFALRTNLVFGFNYVVGFHTEKSIPVVAGYYAQ